MAEGGGQRQGFFPAPRAGKLCTGAGQVPQQAVDEPDEPLRLSPLSQGLYRLADRRRGRHAIHEQQLIHPDPQSLAGQVFHFSQRVLGIPLNHPIEIAAPLQRPVDQGCNELPVARVLELHTCQMLLQELLDRKSAFLLAEQNFYGNGSGEGHLDSGAECRESGEPVYQFFL